ncbi:hypothetical protein J3A83DRAFT_4207654 [Scleroderma citrinum]
MLRASKPSFYRSTIKRTSLPYTSMSGKSLNNLNNNDNNHQRMTCLQCTLIVPSRSSKTVLATEPPLYAYIFTEKRCRRSNWIAFHNILNTSGFYSDRRVTLSNVDNATILTSNDIPRQLDPFGVSHTDRQRSYDHEEVHECNKKEDERKRIMPGTHLDLGCGDKCTTQGVLDFLISSEQTLCIATLLLVLANKIVPVPRNIPTTTF